jgi:penicillin amidase
MKALKISAIVIAVLIILALIGGSLYVRSVARKGLPDYEADTELEGLSGKVVVYRDDFGVPHVYAESEEDLYRTVGYCLAQDRLWQMDLLRRVCTGRLSEIFGEELVQTDLLMRALRIPEKSRLVLAKTEKHILRAVEAFAGGVNFYIRNHRKNLPPEFTILGYKPDEWKPEHSLNLVGYMAWDLTLSWYSEVLLDKIRREVGEAMTQELLPELSSFKSVVYPGFESELYESAKASLGSSLLDGCQPLHQMGLTIFSGSNNWAVAGKKSVTGKPILANDMHLGLNAPGIWSQMHQVVEGKLDVTGVILPGQPFIVAGHNNYIAWGFTNVMVDNADFYMEKVHPDNPHQYELNGLWKDMEVRKENIQIKGGQTKTEELRFTHRGPIVSHFKKAENRAISMRWAGNDDSDELRTLYLLNRAKDWGSFTGAMKTFISVSQNTVYADVGGNIGLYCCAGVPIRKEGDRNTVLPGWTDEFDWKGFVPFEELPYSLNPESGFVSSANNKTIGEDYPFYISRWFSLPYRIDRIREMLAEKDKLSISDFKRMQADKKSKLAESLKKIFISELGASDGLNSLERQCLEMVSSWDGVLEKKSTEALLLEKFLMSFLTNLLLDELGEELFKDFLSSFILREYAVHNVMESKDSLWCDDVNTDGNRETFADIIKKSFKETVESLRIEWGENPVEWEWGKVHRLTLAHPLGSVKVLDRLFRFNRGPFEVGGSYHTVCPYTYPFGNPFAATSGASQRHIYSLADWDASLSVIPTGVSGIPASPHYCDQTEKYTQNQYHPDYTSRSLIEKNAQYKKIFFPAPVKKLADGHSGFSGLREIIYRER